MSNRARKSSAIKSKMILVLGLASTLTACATNPMPVKPTKPTITPKSSGAVCFDRADATALGVYIQQLERGYSQ